jgi:hypothetical protein
MLAGPAADFKDALAVGECLAQDGQDRFFIALAGGGELFGHRVKHN